MSTEPYRKCSKCGSTPHNDKLVSYHRFPKPGKTNLLRSKAWATYCWPDQESWSLEALEQINTSHKVLCKRHFEESCFTDSSKKRLSKFAVPGDKQYVIGLMDFLRKEMKYNTDKSEEDALADEDNILNENDGELEATETVRRISHNEALSALNISLIWANQVDISIPEKRLLRKLRNKAFCMSIRITRQSTI